MFINKRVLTIILMVVIMIVVMHIRTTLIRRCRNQQHSTGFQGRVKIPENQFIFFNVLHYIHTKY